MKAKKTALGLHIALACAAPQLAAAASFQILEQSPAQLGKAFAGTASDVQDATTVFFNPAAMTQLQSNMVSGGLNLIWAESQFTDAGSNTTGQPGKTDELGVVPNVYSVSKLNEQWSLGLGINAPFGLASEYDSNWYGRYLATRSELQVLNINGTAAYKLNDQWSFGFGINYQRMEVTLENNLDSTLGTAPNPMLDSSVVIEGDDHDLVVDLSVYWRPMEAAAVGLVWRQGGSFDLTGRADFDLSEACVAVPQCTGLFRPLEGNITAPVDLPDTLTLSGSYWLNPVWAIHADIAHTQWSSIQSVEITNTDSGEPLPPLDLRYDDTQRISLGATYQPEGPWQWRMGVALDGAPQTDPEFVTPRVPDADRIWLSGGFNYQWSESLSLDVAYTHIFVDDVSIQDTDDFGHAVAGSFDSAVDIFAVQANWRY